jgi:hypothetical protein
MLTAFPYLRQGNAVFGLLIHAQQTKSFFAHFKFASM